MNANRFVWISLSIFLGLLGAYFLSDSINDVSRFADVYVLFGGTLMGLSIISLGAALESHLHFRAMGKHMTGDRQGNRDLRTTRNYYHRAGSSSRA